MKTEIKMKPELLIIGKITPRMAAAFDTAFICHHYDEIPDIDRFISETGKRFGQLLPLDMMAYLRRF